MKPATEFLTVIEAAIASMDEWAYSQALRFSAYDRAHAVARMLHGGFFAISCGFPVDRSANRWLLFGINLHWKDEVWLITVTVEDEADSETRYRWESPPVHARSLAEFSQGLSVALKVLDESSSIPAIAAVFHEIEKRNKV